MFKNIFTVYVVYGKHVKIGHRINDILYLASINRSINQSINQSINYENNLYLDTSYNKNGLLRVILEEFKIRMKSNSKIIVSTF